MASPVDVCTYNITDPAPRWFVHSRPGERPVVQPLLLTSPVDPPTSGLGVVLDNLPTELVWLILDRLDVVSYLRFRQVNRRARAVATGRHEYRCVLRHGFEALHGVLRLGLGSHWSLRGLYRVLVQPDCDFCHGFAGLVFIPTARRCCYQCLVGWPSRPELSVLTLASLASLTNRSAKRLGRLLKAAGPPAAEMPTVPGIYDLEGDPARFPPTLIATVPALEVLVARGRLSDDDAEYIPTQYPVQISQRCMVSTVLPWYDVDKDEAQDGVGCSACRARSSRRNGEPVTLYTRTGFLEHFERCPHAKDMWRQHQNGPLGSSVAE